MISSIPVIFMPASIDACAYYRMYIPHLNTPFSDYYYTGFTPEGQPKSMDLHRVLGRKIAVVQRQSSTENLQAIKTLHTIGCRVIYDLDDNMWNLPHANPAKITFEQHQRGFAMCAMEADLLTVSTRGLKTATDVAFTQKKEIQIIPNSIDLNLFHRKEIERDDDLVVIGWGGSNTHNADVRDVFDIMPEILSANPHAMMEIVGAPAKKERSQEVKILKLNYKEEKVKVNDKEEIKRTPFTFGCIDLKTREEFELPVEAFRNIIKTRVTGKKSKILLRESEVPYERMVGIETSRQVLDDSELAFHDRYRFKPWVPIWEFPNRLASWAWDIAIAPLEENRFNNSKSNIKMLESAVLKIPCLVSPVNPYVEFCALGGQDLNWLLCHNTQEWREKLTTLINEPERRKFLGEKMYQVMNQYFNMEKTRSLWEYAFQTALNT